jgi:selenide,water dikinase
MREAGVILVGGHSIDDAELKYGLSVTGTVHPEQVVTNAGAKAGDKLVLTKPLGTGIITTAAKARVAGEETVARVTRYMATLNRQASEIMQEVGAHAGTDITGFGLLGHTCQLAGNSQVGIKLYVASIPFFPEAEEFARKGFCPGGLSRNREFYSRLVEIAPNIPRHVPDILYDPQTSGGLLISVAPEAAPRLLDRLREAGVAEATIIGEVLDQPVGRVIVE